MFETSHLVLAIAEWSTILCADAAVFVSIYRFFALSGVAVVSQRHCSIIKIYLALCLVLLNGVLPLYSLLLNFEALMSAAALRSLSMVVVVVDIICTMGLLWTIVLRFWMENYLCGLNIVCSAWFPPTE